MPATIPTTPRRTVWAVVRVALAGALVFGGLAAVFDGPIRDAIRAIPFGKDVKRELEMAQQFGGVASMIIAGAVIALLQPWRVRRLLDWILAAGLGWFVFGAIKIATGRLRPRIVDDQWASWIGPMGTFTERRSGADVRPIEFWIDGVYASLAMPSTHTTHAAIAAAFLAGMYPRLRWLVVPWIGVVALGRVWFDAHWPSDVLVGGFLGWALGTVVCRGSWGVRLIDWMWKSVVDRSAVPALGKLVAAEREHGV
jgi:membrane-associated phospholipid phosphatase